MSDQKIAEFRARAELGVTEVDPDLLLRRGTAMRRRRQLVPVGVVAACAAIGFGIFSSLGGDPSTGQDPTSERTEVQYLDDPKYLYGLEAGEYALHPLADSQYRPPLPSGGSPFATVELDGGWYGGSNAAYRSDAGGTVSWGLDLASEIYVDRCHPDDPRLPPGLTRPQVVDGVASVTDTQVTSPPRPASALGLKGTHLQVSIPLDLECPTGTVTATGALLATWDGPSPAPRATVDVWVLGRGQAMVMLTRSVRGDPSPETIASLDAALGTLELGPTG